MSSSNISWKGKTFNQITTSIQKNNALIGLKGGSENLFKSRPLKVYRREIASITNNQHCNVRTSVSIDELNRPNGYLVYSTNVNNDKGLVNAMDIQVPNSKYELSTPSCNTKGACFNQQANALRRVRSSGIITRKVNPATNNSVYYTNTNQYLKGRNKNFEQNQFNYLRSGDPTVKPGSNIAQENIYSSQGTTNCPKVHIYNDLSNNSFQYIWIDGTEVTVTIPDGYYDVDLLNTAFKNAMIQNKHYYINNASLTKVFLLNIAFDTKANVVQLQCFPFTMYHGSSNYSVPTGTTWDVIANNKTPQFKIANPNPISSVIGFLDGELYPSSTSTTAVYLNANTAGSIFPSYSAVYYKPNNTQFSQQGAVSAGTLTARKNYDTITTVAGSFRQPYGSQTASALAYSVSAGSFYTLKDKIGYPNKCTPKIMKNGEMRKCHFTGNGVDLYV